MKELLPTIQQWTKSKQPFATATVIQTWGSSPRPIGSTMLIAADGSMAGSVSGGCVEGAVVKSAKALLESGGGKLLRFGVSDEEAWAVGLSCGGSIEVYVERFMAFDERTEEQQVWQTLQTALEQNKGCILISRLSEGESRHFLVQPDGQFSGLPLSAAVHQAALSSYKERKNQILEEEGIRYFIRVFPRKSQLFVIGAAHITVDLVDLAMQFGFETIVIDPRGAFANKTLFTRPPDELFEKYPSEVLHDFTLDAYTYAAVLSHDPKIDDNALHILLKSQVAYIGALGSKRTQDKRVARLQEAGFSEAEIARIHSPIGVDIHAKTAKEIALSILAEMIGVKNEFM
jgi:xanthine dehydrogenase accessory factor